jgi:hypothetical protein
MNKIAPFVGIVSQYADYRYGTERPVYVPGRKHRRLADRQRREQLVSRVRAILGSWTSSPFEHEAATVHGLRSAWCLAGEKWTIADLEAASIVAEALEQNRARRPSWEEGQWTYADSPDQCAWCRGPIDDEERSRRQRFCCVECAKAALQHMARKTTHHYGAILRSAIRLIDKEKAQARECEHCGRPFKTDASGQRFCSVRCAGIHLAGDRAHRDVTCEHCGTVFHQRVAGQRYCSMSCGRKATLAKEAAALAQERRTCACCGAEFSPPTKTALYCSRRCQKVMNDRKAAQRLKEARAPQPRNCAWCGCSYLRRPTGPTARPAIAAGGALGMRACMSPRDGCRRC